jgi:glutamate-ammonia-ligase adenylyltransferase
LELRPDEQPSRDAAWRAHATDARTVALLAMLEAGERAEAERLLGEHGFSDTDRAARSLTRLYHGRVTGPASPQRRRAMEAMAPALLQAVSTSADPNSALDQLVEFLIHTGAHTSYLALLGGSPATMQTLVVLFAASPYLAASLVGQPELLDMLVRSDADPSGRGTMTLREALDEDLAGPLDEEGTMSALRKFRTSETIRAGIDDLSGLLNAEEIQQLLSDLGEACLCAAADQAKRLVAERTGQSAEGVQLAIVAMGKMGGREMTYGSDLDLMFVYRGDQPGFDDRAHGFATRWVQKTISLLQSSTRDGIAYRIDARLRPSGKSGPLVVSLDRFVEYHCKEAALWERQAHIRARVVYGDPRLRATVAESIERFVYGTGLGPEGVTEIDGLRRRVEEELAREAQGRSNIKTGRGGIVDIEFLVQMLQLREGHVRPELRCRGTLESIRALRGAKILRLQDADLLEKHYLFLRRVEARMRLEFGRPVEELGTDAAALAPLARRLGFREGEPGRALLEVYERTRSEVRALYERYFTGVFDV